MRVYFAPLPAQCAFQRLSTSLLMPQYKAPLAHKIKYTLHVPCSAVLLINSFMESVLPFLSGL